MFNSLMRADYEFFYEYNKNGSVFKKFLFYRTVLLNSYFLFFSLLSHLVARNVPRLWKI